MGLNRCEVCNWWQDKGEDVCPICKVMDVKAYRLKLGLSQQKMAEKLGVSICAVSSWEQNRRNISVRLQERLLKLGGVK